MLDTSCGIVHKELQEDDLLLRRPDISRTKEQFGWSPSIPLSEGIEQSIL